MQLYATLSLDVLAEDVEVIARHHHPSGSEIAKAYIVGVLGQNVRTSMLAQEDPDSPRLGYPSLVEMRQFRVENPTQYKNLGDYCLLFSGLFYERAKQRGFLEYQASVGADAYRRFGKLIDTTGSPDPLFDELSQDFSQWEKVLHVLSAQGMSDAGLVQLLESHLQKPDDRYAAILQAKGISVASNFGEN
ncbi:hypothetical protein HZA99_02905 [Candidatus Woesearchaeota archaeon]|nr:hypothetical protein [Candidatus Woesearchaeota archaeon]